MKLNVLGRKGEITITVIIRGEKLSIKTYPGEYRNLMMLLFDKFYLDDFGECKGIGRCGTCHVLISGSGEEVLQRVRNENTTLSKMTEVTERSRLACQITINETLDGVVVELVSEG